ncbi:fizzy-related protein homolog [Temnothorax longispinosus]|uniref:fizzy-related protein homolog n=1 Tax=Temnothorax longispinosus TaxID=300112 RepID=UPI003A9900C0
MRERRSRYVNYVSGELPSRGEVGRIHRVRVRVMFHHEYEKRLLKPVSGDASTATGTATLPGAVATYSPIYFSPTKTSACNNSYDRFIPTRSGNNWQTTFSMISENGRGGLVAKKTRENGEGSRDGIAYSCLLKNELLGASIEDVKGQCEERRVLSPLVTKNLFKYTTPTKDRTLLDQSSPYSLSPLSAKSQKLLRSPRKATRKISRIPFKVLDAPELQDDFYLNLVDWSSQNVLSVGLGSCVYLWSAFLRRSSKSPFSPLGSPTIKEDLVKTLLARKKQWCVCPLKNIRPVGEPMGVYAPRKSGGECAPLPMASLRLGVDERLCIIRNTSEIHHLEIHWKYVSNKDAHCNLAENVGHVKIQINGCTPNPAIMDLRTMKAATQYEVGIKRRLNYSDDVMMFEHNS